MRIRSRVEAGAVRVCEALIARACRPLPAAERDERYAEWTAELPAIPGCHRFWPAGVLAMLCFSADQFRTTRPARRLARLAAGQQARTARRTRHRDVVLEVLNSVLSVVFVGIFVGSVIVNGVSDVFGILSVLGILSGVVLVAVDIWGRNRRRRHAASGTGTDPGVCARQQ